MSLTLVALMILSVLTAGMILTFVRLLRGPSLPDRIVALDLIVTLLIGIIATYAILNNQPAFLDVAIILALVSFLGTVAFAYYIERRV
ncbi:monovalent cation/H+ antiporter complex subunit F [uncultured Thermanaerothrix sp.]|uniref:monovalent cation/H+ antiporter complex subunit F n=1 Tax=uncultured Thermanaerothrix sp. TaxID=1195149 RepID=UPI0026070B9C|nr:monovalent cation/H+ antiporter complex subunit F [uncultured Thermanaerothrix sp.]